MIAIQPDLLVDGFEAKAAAVLAATKARHAGAAVRR